MESSSQAIASAMRHEIATAVADDRAGRTRNRYRRHRYRGDSARRVVTISRRRSGIVGRAMAGAAAARADLTRGEARRWRPRPSCRARCTSTAGGRGRRGEDPGGHQPGRRVDDRRGRLRRPRRRRARPSTRRRRRSRPGGPPRPTTGQDPQEDRRPDARAGRHDRPDLDAGAGQAAAPRPRGRPCTPPTRSNGSPRRGSAPTAGSSRRRTWPSGITRSSTRSASSARSPPGTSPSPCPAARSPRPWPPAARSSAGPADQTPLTLIQMFECLVDGGPAPGRGEPRDGRRPADRRRLLRAPEPSARSASPARRPWARS